MNVLNGRQYCEQMVCVVLVMFIRVMMDVRLVVCSIMIILLLYCGRVCCSVDGRRMWWYIFRCDMFIVLVVLILLWGVVFRLLVRILVVQVLVLMVNVRQVQKEVFDNQGYSVFLCIVLNCVRLQQIRNSWISIGVLWIMQVQSQVGKFISGCLEICISVSGIVSSRLISREIESSLRVISRLLKQSGRLFQMMEKLKIMIGFFDLQFCGFYVD